MVIGAAGACVLGAWREAGLLLSLFGLGHVLEERAMARTRRAVSTGAGQAAAAGGPVAAGRDLGRGTGRRGGRGDHHPGATGQWVALDGVVDEGHSALDQAAVTGESVPVSRQPGNRVFAGTINTEAALAESRSPGGRRLDPGAGHEAGLSEAEAHKGKTQRLTQRIERTFVPLVLAATTVLAIVLIARGVARGCPAALDGGAGGRLALRPGHRDAIRGALGGGSRCPRWRADQGRAHIEAWAR